MKRNRKYYIHRVLKKHGIVVKSRRKQIEFTELLFNNLPTTIQAKINELAKAGYNCQICIA